jgi:hypothetical protein
MERANKLAIGLFNVVPVETNRNNIRRLSAAQILCWQDERDSELSMRDTGYFVGLLIMCGVFK